MFSLRIRNPMNVDEFICNPAEEDTEMEVLSAEDLLNDRETLYAADQLRAVAFSEENWHELKTNTIIKNCFRHTGIFVGAAEESSDDDSCHNGDEVRVDEIIAMGWLCMERTPKPFVESFVEGLDFWGNKIRVQFKRSNPDQIVFVEAFKRLFVELTAYIKAYHLTGVTWNPKGRDVAVYTATVPDKSTAISTDAGAATFFNGVEATDQSSGKTAWPEKVTKGDLLTRRSEFKADGAASPSHMTSAPAAKKPTTLVKTAKLPVCKQRNGNWHIEYQMGPEPLTVNDVSMKQQVYIFGCEGATILLEGKAKNIVLDSCKRSKLIFDAAVSSVEIVNCTSVQVQCKSRVPSVAIDKTDGCLVYISWEGREVQFVTSKSSEMNVAFPKGPHSDDCVETPIPEQFVHKIMDDFTVSSDVSSLFSHCRYE
ncbi:hypothetical protein BBJ28_00016763 [Nothophytophthora sp. Chile5]|nr:hypothetical protein BBJ28_00016763 [Nothophytophthora sp. Chile5]